jgi:two-component system chemotaxis sensor kinase CheA
LIRNAADHGIEPTDTRVAKGKNPIGKIKLTAYQEGTKAVIKVEDDGAGLNVERIKNKAERVGISTDGLSENDIKNLIFVEGFSTNEKVTDISGRGVGMDVVKTKIAALGGTVDVVSEVDKGSSFIIKLPLTLQIIQALLVKVSDQTMAISLGYIDRVIDFKDDMLKKTNNKEVIIYRDNVIPLIKVSERLQIENSVSEKRYVVIVKVGEKTVGLLVDGLLGQQEIVIKHLGKTLDKLKEYIGATILGDGLVTLILDVAYLV